MKQPFIEPLHFSLVSLTQTHNLMSRLVPPSTYVPIEFVYRLMVGGSMGEREAKGLIQNIPSLEAKKWTEYWSDQAKKFIKQDRHSAACMCYLFGSFPKDQTIEKQSAFSNQIKSFQKWCASKNRAYEEIFVRRQDTSIRFYLKPPSKIKKKHPVIIFINGLEGAAEEVAFSIDHLEDYPVGYAVLSVPGSWDYSEPMNLHSEKEIQKVLDYLETVDWVDKDKIGIVGFSFGAYWAMVTTKVDPRIKFCVCNGLPLRHSFALKKAFGLNPIISRALHALLKASNPLELGWKLHQLQSKGLRLIQKPSAPILGINGSNDRIVDVRDTIELGSLKNNQARLIPDARHCAVDQFRKMTSLLAVWIKKHA